MNNRYIKILVVGLVIIIIGCSAKQYLTTENIVVSFDQINYEKLLGLTGGGNELTIHNNGKVDYTLSKYHDGPKISAVTSINKSELLKLSNLIEETDVFSLEDRYNQTGPYFITDSNRITIEFIIGSKSKKIRFDQMKKIIPTNLYNILEVIYSLEEKIEKAN